jgi:hypothetical protein
MGYGGSRFVVDLIKVLINKLSSARRSLPFVSGSLVLALVVGAVGFHLGRQDRVPAATVTSLENQLSSLTKQSGAQDSENITLRGKLSQAELRADNAEDKLDVAAEEKAASGSTSVGSSGEALTLPAPTPSSATPSELKGNVIATLALDPGLVDDMAVEKKKCFSIADKQIQFLAGDNSIVAIGKVAGRPHLDLSKNDGTFFTRTCTWKYTVSALPPAPVYTVRVIPTGENGNTTAKPDVTKTVSAADLASGKVPTISYRDSVY